MISHLINNSIILLINQNKKFWRCFCCMPSRICSEDILLMAYLVGNIYIYLWEVSKGKRGGTVTYDRKSLHRNPKHMKFQNMHSKKLSKVVRKISLEYKKRLLNYCLLSIPMYDIECWTISFIMKRFQEERLSRATHWKRFFDRRSSNSI